jgi:ABC-type glycerol-3-phosphate transport system substrate-binding protein
MKAILSRGLLLLLVLAIALSACACSDSGKKGSDTKVEPMEGEVPVDLNGYEFQVIDFNDGRWKYSDSGTPFGDAWNQILDEVQGLYNCTITMESVSPDGCFTKVQPEIMSGEKCADLIVATEWEYGKLIAGNLMRDLNTLDVNWDNKWWNQNVRQMSTNQGKTFATNGSFIFDTAQTWLLYYNQDVWQELKLPDPYELVNSGKWTMDKYREYCKKAMRDDDGSGKVDSSSDRWGVIGAAGDYCRALFMALGGKYFTTNPENGHVELACNNTKTFDIVEQMYGMVKQDQSFCTLSFTNEQEKITMFANNRALFYAYMPGISGLKDMESDWGVMPLPKFNEEQEQYLSGVDHNAAVCGVPSSNDNIKEVSAILEALGRHGVALENVYWPDYNETYWRHPEEDSAILSDHVVGHGQYDIALLMQNCNSAAFGTPMSLVFGTVHGGSGSDFSSLMEAAHLAIEINVAEFFGYDPPEMDY